MPAARSDVRAGDQNRASPSSSSDIDESDECRECGPRQPLREKYGLFAAAADTAGGERSRTGDVEGAGEVFGEREGDVL